MRRSNSSTRFECLLVCVFVLLRFGQLLNYIDVPVLSIHGKQKQAKRTATFFEFCNAKTGEMMDLW